MTEPTLWWLLVAVAVTAELLTGTFYLLMLALGLAGGAIAAHLGASLTVQLAAAAVLGGGAVALLQVVRPKPLHRPPPQADADVLMDVGQTVHIAQWAAHGPTQATYRGAQWTVELVTPMPSPTPGAYRICEVVGSVLRVEPS
jgi:membrane protein implicated in regulation of membrane protease activity